MAGEVEKLSGKLGIDTTDFKTAIAAANRELRVLESGFKASAAALGDWTKDATGLESRVKSLTSQIDIQSSKVEALRAEHQRLVEAHGENSRAAQDAEIKLNKETETLGKMQNELGGVESSLAEMTSGEEETGAAAEEMGDQAEDAGEKFETLEAIAGGLGTALKGLVTVMAAVGAAAIAAVAAIGGLVISSANAAAEIVDMSTKTGISTTRLQELDFIANQVGTSLDTITSSQARLVRSMASAQEQTQDYTQKLAEAQKAGKDINAIELGDAAQAFQQLGVSVTDSSGNLRNTEAVFNDLVDALGRVSNPAERDAIAMELFGKSAQELNPLIKTGSSEMARLAQEAHNVGAVMSEEDVAALEAFDDTLASLTAGLKGTLGTLATAFLPVFEQVFGPNGAGKYLKEFAALVSSADGDFGKLAEGLTGLITEIATDIAKSAPQLLQAGLSIVRSLLDAIIAALPQMLTAATEILTALVNFIVQALPQLLQAGVQILLTLVTAIIENLPMLVDAALQAIIALANGLAEALPELIPAVVQAVITIVQTLTENIPMLVDAALALILGLAEGLIAALPILIAALPQIIDAILNALITSMPQIFEAAGQLIGMLAYGILASIPVVLVAALELLTRLVFTMRTWWTEKLPEAGKNFVIGLAEGIKNGAGILYQAVTDLINNMLATIYGLLHMNSPSGVGIDIGRNFLQSIPLGGQQVMADVEKSFAAMMSQLTTAASGALGGAGGSVSSSVQNDSFQFFAPVVLQGDTPAGSLGARLKGRRY